MGSGTGINFALAVFGLVALPANAGLLTSQGAKGTLSVQYEYSAIGMKADKYAPAEWRVLRTINLVVPMKADPPQPMPVLRPAKADAASASKMGAPRYQLWQPVTQRGTYLVDETYRGQTSDPLCSDKPKQRCSREETRKGSGDIPAPPGARDTSAAMLEVDSQKKDVLIKLPIPLSALTYSRRVTSEFPDERSGTTLEILPAMFGQQKLITAVIPGDLRTASGTQSFKVDGAQGEGGTLTVKWQFAQQ
jgi:hypothetical protein